MLSLLPVCTLPFDVLSGQHIFHQFQQQTFFSVLIFNKLFFSDFCGDKYFFQFQSSPPPPPQISNCASLKTGLCFGKEMDILSCSVPQLNLVRGSSTVIRKR